MYQELNNFLKDKKRICIIQAENPDGDSLGSAIGLDYILQDYEISLYCPIEIPKYLRYFEDWSRIGSDFDFKADGYIIVDTAAKILLSRLLEDSAVKNRLEVSPVFVIDHHETEDDLPFSHTAIIEQCAACCQLIYKIASECHLAIPEKAADVLAAGIMSDTLGLVSESVSVETFQTITELVKVGADIPKMDEARREFMKKTPRILDYKADLIKRIEYFLDGELATVHIPWDDIRKYSDEYNPNALILEELRLVTDVKVAVSIKTYPDGKVTGKVRSMEPIAEQVAGYFGGGGHAFAAGFKVYDSNYDEIVTDLIQIVPKLLAEQAKDE